MVCSNCVSEGHGGSRAADYVKQNLFKNLLEHPQFVSDTKLAIGMQFLLLVHANYTTIQFILPNFFS